MLKCRNCEAENDDTADHCKDCQANLKLAKYSREDDPVTQNAALQAENQRLQSELETEKQRHVPNEPGPVQQAPKHKPFFG